jgi:O-antigen/teichoic acid export membrane protein
MSEINAASPLRAMMLDVGILMRGTIIAQGLGLLLMPVFSRLYSPEDFGTFALYQAALLLLSVIACMRYELAIFGAIDEAEATGLFRLSLTIAALVAAILLLPLIAIAVTGYGANLTGTMSPIWLAPATFISGGALAAGAYFTRLGEFKRAASSKIAQASTNGIATTVYGVAAPTGAGLVLGDLAGKAITILMAFRLYSVAHLKGGARPRLRTLSRKYVNFPKLSVVGGLLNNGGSFLTPFILFHAYGAEVAGQFALTDRVISLPLGLVIVSLSQAFSSHCAKLLRESPSQAEGYFKSLVRQSALLGVFPLIIGFFAAPFAFPLLFGAEWTLSGHFAQLLAPMYFSSIIAGPIQSALVVLGKLRHQLIWEAARFGLLIVVWGIILQANLGSDIAVIGFAWVNIVVNIAFVWIAWIQIKETVRVMNPIETSGSAY